MHGLGAILAAAQARESGGGKVDFFIGLSKKEACVRLIDAYRLRLDDDYVWGGCNLHGLYASKPPLRDFREFMRLAARNDCLPSWWNPAVDNTAIEDTAMTDDWANINYAVEKSDIIEHYDGGTPMLLRMLAEKAYGTSLSGQPVPSPREPSRAAEGGRTCINPECNTAERTVAKMACSICKAPYCCRKCQRGHWKHHKAQCNAQPS